MKKNFIIILIIILGLLIGIYYFGYLYKLNYLIKQNLDISCNIDVDCDVFIIPDNAHYCGSFCGNYNFNGTNVIVINKNWKPSCPFTKPRPNQIVQCVSGIDPPNYKNMIKCINKQCIKVLSGNSENLVEFNYYNKTFLAELPLTEESAKNLAYEVLDDKNLKTGTATKGLNDSFFYASNYDNKTISKTIPYRYNENIWVVSFGCVNNEPFCGGRVLIDENKREIKLEMVE